MLGPQFGKLNRIPSWVLLWFSWWNNRTCPSDPSVSPIYGSLGGLPPLLVQASSAEMLHDDAVRYVNKARASGSPVQLQTWEHMVHVWQIFLTDLPEARAAFAEIEAFIQSCRAQEQTEAAA
jgi:monoterpene epsilon-lactone hydrolase